MWIRIINTGCSLIFRWKVGLNVKLDENRIILEQSFHADLDDWGDVRFVSYGPAAGSYFEDVSFYLMKNGKVVFVFPYYGENNKTDQYAGLFDSVEAVAFHDVNGDNLKDVIVIINYITGAGPQGMEPRPKARIFLADKKGFILAKDMTDDVNDHGAHLRLSEKQIISDCLYGLLETSAPGVHRTLEALIYISAGLCFCVIRCICFKLRTIGGTISIVDCSHFIEIP